MYRTVLAFVAALLCLQSSAVAQISYAWTFDELRSKSDLVVIAAFTGTQDTGLKTELSEVQPAEPVVELNTEFRVLSTLQGVQRPTILLRHYRTDATRLTGTFVNGPRELDFSTAPTTVFLLFLKHESDNRYAPTSGQVIPDESIMALPKNSLTLFPR